MSCKLAQRQALFTLTFLFIAYPAFAEPATRPTSKLQTTLTFLGDSTAVPAAGDDTSCFIINRTLLIDCGWNSANTMRQYGYDPLKLDTLFITHFHHDHYMGLPGLLFSRGMGRTALAGKPALRIVGPADDLPIVVELSRRFLQVDRFPEVWPAIELDPLEPGKSYETDAIRIDTIKALHPVTGFCSRLTDKRTGRVIAFSGDTALNLGLVKLAANADLLIHEASLSPRTPDGNSGAGHSRAIDAANIARDANVKRLIITHLPASQRKASLDAAKRIFPNTSLATMGQTIILEK